MSPVPAPQNTQVWGQDSFFHRTKSQSWKKKAALKDQCQPSMEAPLQGASWSGRQAQNQQDPHTAKASSRSQAGSLQRLCGTSVPHPSVHPRVDALPRLLHQPSAHGQLTGTRKDGGTLLQMITKREQQLTAGHTDAGVSLGWGFPPDTDSCSSVCL